MMSVQDAAQELLAAFDLDFGDHGMVVRLSPDAPDLVPQLALTVFGGEGAEEMVKLFEALSAIGESEDPHLCEIDEKVCGLDHFRHLVTELERAIGLC